MNRLTRRATLGAATAFALTQGARAQAWPSKPIRILVPFPAGGVADIVTRALADPMQADLGQTNNLAEKQPGVAKALHAKLVAWRESVGAKMPTKNDPQTAQAAGGGGRKRQRQRNADPDAD